ncbi:MAG: GNAT family N-acetyltransferase [Nitrospinota bacterium]|nr:GNAT family N-acetyltransferase [Nitrospinota bacterium]
MEQTKEGYTLTDDNVRMDVKAIHALLIATYWAGSRTLEATEKSVKSSICFGVFHDGRQAGFARVVTDGAVFSWLCDVVVDEAHRGKGLGKWLLEAALAHPDVQGTEVILRTRGTEKLYARYGFEYFDEGLSWMGIKENRPSCA